jgi:hypothetical protein
MKNLSEHPVSRLRIEPTTSRMQIRISDHYIWKIGERLRKITENLICDLIRILNGMQVLGVTAANCWVFVHRMMMC